ncbi:hypothetical protein PG985_001682 [Apiospora marii]|uniref:uncharacterized protein n=1 Tax=Apiospora marii TaxID=335849 RepID=UPI00312F0A8E
MQKEQCHLQLSCSDFKKSNHRYKAPVVSQFPLTLIADLHNQQYATETLFLLHGLWDGYDGRNGDKTYAMRSIVFVGGGMQHSVGQRITGAPYQTALLHLLRSG